MLRKMICLLMVLCLCAPARSEDAPSHLYHFTTVSEAPEEIAADIADLFGSDITYVDGYAAMRFGKWTHGQIILQDAQGYILCCLRYAGDNASGTWDITYSRTALREGALPQLLPEQQHRHHKRPAEFFRSRHPSRPSCLLQKWHCYMLPAAPAVPLHPPHPGNPQKPRSLPRSR